MGWSGIREESFGLEKNTKGSIRKQAHAATLMITCAIFLFKVLADLKWLNFFKAIEELTTEYQKLDKRSRLIGEW